MFGCCKPPNPTLDSLRFVDGGVLALCPRPPSYLWYLLLLLFSYAIIASLTEVPAFTLKTMYTVIYYYMTISYLIVCLSPTCPWPLLLSKPASSILMPYFWSEISSLRNHLLVMSAQWQTKDAWNYCGWYHEATKKALDCSCCKQICYDGIGLKLLV